MKRIGILLPHLTPWTPLEFGNCLHQLLLNTPRYNKLGYELGTISATCGVLTKLRNDLVKQALTSKCDYIYTLDVDVPFKQDHLEKLLAHDKDIVIGTYRYRAAPYTVEGRQMDMNDRGPLRKMNYGPLGHALIKADVFRKLPPPWFTWAYKQDGTDVGEDWLFFNKARQAGYDVWCDFEVSAELGHFGYEVFWTNEAPGARIVENAKKSPGVVE